MKKLFALILVFATATALFGCAEQAAPRPAETLQELEEALRSIREYTKEYATESPPDVYQMWDEFRGKAYANGLRNAEFNTDLIYNGKFFTFNTDVINVADFDGDGNEETLTINVSRDLPGADDEDNDYNNPVRVIAKIGDAELIYESFWNDGVKMSIVDFDSEDKFVEFYIYESGTDVGGTVNIYRYDGESIICIAAIASECGLPVYDGKGKIYTLDEKWEISESFVVHDLRTMTAAFFEP